MSAPTVALLDLPAILTGLIRRIIFIEAGMFDAWLTGKLRGELRGIQLRRSLRFAILVVAFDNQCEWLRANYGSLPGVRATLKTLLKDSS